MTTLSQIEPVRHLLSQVGLHLTRACDLLKEETVNYHQLRHHLEQVARLCPRVILRWHGHDTPEKMSLDQQNRSAISLSSSLRLPLERLRPLLALGRTPEPDSPLSVYDRETIQTGFYTARNLYFSTLGELPASIRPDMPLMEQTHAFPLSPFRSTPGCFERAAENLPRTHHWVRQRVLSTSAT